MHESVSTFAFFRFSNLRVIYAPVLCAFFHRRLHSSVGVSVVNDIIIKVKLSKYSSTTCKKRNSIEFETRRAWIISISLPCINHCRAFAFAHFLLAVSSNEFTHVPLPVATFSFFSPSPPIIFTHLHVRQHSLERERTYTEKGRIHARVFQLASLLLSFHTPRAYVIPHLNRD